MAEPTPLIIAIDTLPLAGPGGGTVAGVTTAGDAFPGMLQQRLQTGGTAALSRPTVSALDEVADSVGGEMAPVSGNSLPPAEMLNTISTAPPVVAVAGQIGISGRLQAAQLTLAPAMTVTALAADIAHDAQPRTPVSPLGLPAGLPKEWVPLSTGSLAGTPLPAAGKEIAAIITHTTVGQTASPKPQMLVANRPISAAMQVALAQAGVSLGSDMDARLLLTAAQRSISAPTPGYAPEAGVFISEPGISRPAAGLPVTLNMLEIMRRELPPGGSVPERVLPLSPAVVEATGSGQIHNLLANNPLLSSAPLGMSAAPALTVATSMGQSGWAAELGQRVTWMARAELREAQLQLHPKSLGPIEVRIVYGHEQQLNVSFSASNVIAREALDAALPRLREMFEQQGLNLMEADISHESFAERRRRQETEIPAPLRKSLADSSGETTSISVGATIVGEGMIDAYV